VPLLLRRPVPLNKIILYLLVLVQFAVHHHVITPQPIKNGTSTTTTFYTTQHLITSAVKTRPTASCRLPYLYFLYSNLLSVTFCISMSPSDSSDAAPFAADSQSNPSSSKHRRKSKSQPRESSTRSSSSTRSRHKMALLEFEQSFMPNGFGAAAPDAAEDHKFLVDQALQVATERKLKKKKKKTAGDGDGAHSLSPKKKKKQQVSLSIPQPAASKTTDDIMQKTTTFRSRKPTRQSLNLGAHLGNAKPIKGTSVFSSGPTFQSSSLHNKHGKMGASSDHTPLTAPISPSSSSGASRGSIKLAVKPVTSNFPPPMTPRTKQKRLTLQIKNPLDRSTHTTQTMDISTHSHSARRTSASSEKGSTRAGRRESSNSVTSGVTSMEDWNTGELRKNSTHAATTTDPFQESFTFNNNNDISDSLDWNECDGSVDHSADHPPAAPQRQQSNDPEDIINATSPTTTHSTAKSSLRLSKSDKQALQNSPIIDDEVLLATIAAASIATGTKLPSKTKSSLRTSLSMLAPEITSTPLVNRRSLLVNSSVDQSTRSIMQPSYQAAQSTSSTATTTKTTPQESSLPSAYAAFLGQPKRTSETAKRRASSVTPSALHSATAPTNSSLRSSLMEQSSTHSSSRHSIRSPTPEEKLSPGVFTASPNAFAALTSPIRDAQRQGSARSKFKSKNATSAEAASHIMKSPGTLSSRRQLAKSIKHKESSMPGMPPLQGEEITPRTPRQSSHRRLTIASPRLSSWQPAPIPDMPKHLLEEEREEEKNNNGKVDRRAVMTRTPRQASSRKSWQPNPIPDMPKHLLEEDSDEETNNNGRVDRRAAMTRTPRQASERKISLMSPRLAAWQLREKLKRSSIIAEISLEDQTADGSTNDDDAAVPPAFRTTAVTRSSPRKPRVGATDDDSYIVDSRETARIEHEKQIRRCSVATSMTNVLPGDDENLPPAFRNFVPL
jgi:hypothetical protein